MDGESNIEGDSFTPLISIVVKKYIFLDGMSTIVCSNTRSRRNLWEEKKKEFIKEGFHRSKLGIRGRGGLFSHSPRNASTTPKEILKKSRSNGRENKYAFLCLGISLSHPQG